MIGLGNKEKMEKEWQLPVIWFVAPESISQELFRIESFIDIPTLVIEAEGIADSPWCVILRRCSKSSWLMVGLFVASGTAISAIVVICYAAEFVMTWFFIYFYEYLMIYFKFC